MTGYHWTSSCRPDCWYLNSVHQYR